MSLVTHINNFSLFIIIFKRFHGSRIFNYRFQYDHTNNNGRVFSLSSLPLQGHPGTIY